MMTSSTALTGASGQTKTIARTHPLLGVMRWELRRFQGSRVFWLQVLGLFCFFVLVTWVEGMAYQIPVPSSAGVLTGASAFIPGTSAWGLLVNLPTTLALLVVLLPFITADGVTRDLQRRTHELLMSSALPSWAYVWGRYLTGLLMSLGLAAMLLVAILGVGTGLRLTVASYPAPELGTVLTLWVGMVVPATILVSRRRLRHRHAVPTPLKGGQDRLAGGVGHRHADAAQPDQPRIGVDPFF